MAGKPIPLGGCLNEAAMLCSSGRGGSLRQRHARLWLKFPLTGTHNEKIQGSGASQQRRPASERQGKLLSWQLVFLEQNYAFCRAALVEQLCFFAN